MRNPDLAGVLDGTMEAFDRALEKVDERARGIEPVEVGTVRSVGRGVARVDGINGVKLEELVRFSGGGVGVALNLDPGEVGVVLIGEGDGVMAGAEVRRTGRVMEVPVGETLLGRVVDAIGRPVDGLGPVRSAQARTMEREAPAIMDRAPVTVPLETGLKVVDALIPIGRGQRELILGDRQSGKTAIALDTMINQRGKNVVCVYCAVGQRSASVAKLISDLKAHGAMEYTTVVVAGGEDPPGMKYIAPYAATSMAEHFMEMGRDALIVYDDLTAHATAYRELSLLLRRPPGREAYPGDIFYIHSRLLERATHLRDELGGGSLTALPIVETEAQNVSAYIPTNLISITDGQIYVSPDLFQKGMLPAVDVGKSVSRVGGKTQLPSYRMVSAALKLSYSQFEELEKFARFSTRLDDSTKKTIGRGRRVREVLKQDQFSPLPLPEQIGVLLAVTEGVFDGLSLDDIPRAEEAVRRAMREELKDLCRKIDSGDRLSDEDRAAVLGLARDTVGRI